MAKTISVAELKRHLSEVLGDVAHGKQIVLVTRHGRPMAQIVPLESVPGSLADVAGWLDERDPFFTFVNEAVAARKRHVPRSWKSS